MAEFDPYEYLKNVPAPQPLFDPVKYLANKTPEERQAPRWHNPGGGPAPEGPATSGDPTYDMFVPQDAQNAQGTWGDRARQAGQYYGELGTLAADSGTFGLGNRALAYGRGLASAATEGGNPLDRYDLNIEEQNRFLQKLRDADPERAVAADLVGGVAGGTGLAKAGINLAKPGVGWIERGVRGLVEGGLLGGLQGGGQHYGPWAEKAAPTAMGSVLGGTGGAAIPLAGSVAQGAKSVAKGVTGVVDDIPVPVLRAAEADRAALEKLPISEGGMLVDSPSMQGLAQGAFVTKGAGSNKLEANLRQREKETGSRLTELRRRLLGDAVEPAEFTAANEALRKTLKPEYDAVWDKAKPVDTTNVADWLDRMATGKRGLIQDAAAAVRKDLNAYGKNTLDTNPETLHSTREAIDAILYDKTTPPPKEVADLLKEARAKITAELHEKVPGIANVDAKYQEFASRQDAYDAGRKALKTGEDPIAPRTFEAQDTKLGLPKGTQAETNTLAGPSAAPLASRQGTTYDIDATLGTNTNNLRKLKDLYEQDYNVKKLTTQYGIKTTEEFQNAINNNLAFREAYQKIVHGAKTAQTLAAAKESGAIELPSTNITSLALDMYNRYRAGTAANQRNRISEIMATQGDDLGPLRDSILAAAAEQKRRDIARTMIESAATRGLTGEIPNATRRLEVRPNSRRP